MLLTGTMLDMIWHVNESTFVCAVVQQCIEVNLSNCIDEYSRDPFPLSIVFAKTATFKVRGMVPLLRLNCSFCWWLMDGETRRRGCRKLNTVRIFLLTINLPSNILLRDSSVGLKKNLE